jgi:Matrixin
MVNLNLRQILLLAFGVFFSSGYRIAQSSFGVPMRWDITAAKPVIWVDVCDDLRNMEFENIAFPTGDPLELSYPSAIDAITSVFAEFLGESLDTMPLSDERYSDAAAANRTITVCTSSTTYAQAAHASPTDNSKLCDDGKSEFAAQNRDYCAHTRIASCAVGGDGSYFRRSSDTFVHVLTHEIGHCLGLMHNHETAESVMSYVGNRQKTVRLTIDDKSALAFLYPETPSKVRQTADFGLSSCTPPRK